MRSEAFRPTQTRLVVCFIPPSLAPLPGLGLFPPSQPAGLRQRGEGEGGGFMGVSFRVASDTSHYRFILVPAVLEPVVGERLAQMENAAELSHITRVWGSSLQWSSTERYVRCTKWPPSMPSQYRAHGWAYFGRHLVRREPSLHERRDSRVRITQLARGQHAFPSPCPVTSCAEGRARCQRPPAPYLPIPGREVAGLSNAKPNPLPPPRPRRIHRRDTS